MYELSVGCIFRNESHSIQEWIEHYYNILYYNIL